MASIKGWAALRFVSIAAMLRALFGSLFFVICAWSSVDCANADPACLSCHSAPSMGKARVTVRSLAGSEHARLQCLDCHSAMSGESASHPIPAPKPDCERCHVGRGEPRAKLIDPLRHGKPDAPSELKPKCWDCHGGHQVLESSDNDSLVGRINLVNTCAACHAAGGAAAKRIGQRQLIEYKKSAHARPDPKLHYVSAAVCSDCHGSHSILPETDPASTVHKSSVPRTCGRCHNGQYQQFRASVHGKALARGEMAAPSCTDCHGEHKILGSREQGSTISPVRVPETCAKCHADKQLVRRLRLPIGQVDSYRRSYHGVANRFGEIRVASCASCHEAHLILPENDPKSSIHPANLPETCGSPDCHPGAGINFARGNMHLQPSPETDKAVYWVTLGYTVFIWLLIGQFVALILADLYQHGKRGFKARGSEPSRPLDEVKVRRFTKSQIRQHWTLILSFTMLLVTGMPLRFADSDASGWIVGMFGGETVRGGIHRLMAVLLIAVCVWHLVWTIFTKRGRADFIRMLPTLRDIPRAIGMMKYYFGLQMDMPGFGRFNLIEKFEYLAMGWGSVVMIVTGFALWFPEIAMRYIPKWGIDICHVVHGYEAVLAFLAITIWHFYHVHFKPGIFPMNRTWLTGDVSLAEMRHEHRLEYERLVRELAEKKGLDLSKAAPEDVRQAAEEIGESVSMRDDQEPQPGSAGQDDDGGAK